MPWAFFVSSSGTLQPIPRSFGRSLARISRLGWIMLRFFVIPCLCVRLRWTCAPRWSVPVTACTHASSVNSLLAISFGGVRCYSKRSSFWILGYFDHWLARSACRQRVSLLLLLALLSPCMSSMAMFLGTIAIAYVCTSLSFGGGGACYGLISAQITNLMVIKKMSVSARRFALHDLPSRMFLWTIMTVTIMKNTQPHARLIEQNLLFAIC